MLQIPKIGGQPGPISVLANLPPGDNPDGVAMDVHGDAFIAMNLQNAIGEVHPDGSLNVVASGDPLDFPSSVAFGTARGGRTKLFGVNFSISEALRVAIRLRSWSLLAGCGRAGDAGALEPNEHHPARRCSDHGDVLHAHPPKAS